MRTYFGAKGLSLVEKLHVLWKLFSTVFHNLRWFPRGICVFNRTQRHTKPTRLYGCDFPHTFNMQNKQMENASPHTHAMPLMFGPQLVSVLAEKRMAVDETGVQVINAIVVWREAVAGLRRVLAKPCGESVRMCWSPHGGLGRGNWIWPWWSGGKGKGMWNRKKNIMIQTLMCHLIWLDNNSCGSFLSLQFFLRSQKPHVLQRKVPSHSHSSLTLRTVWFSDTLQSGEKTWRPDLTRRNGLTSSFPNKWHSRQPSHRLLFTSHLYNISQSNYKYISAKKRGFLCF